MTLLPTDSMSIRRGAQGRDFDFLIVGGGITGCVMASLLVNRKLAAPDRVAIVAGAATPAPVPADADSEWDLRVFALSRASQRLLTICGAWPLLPTQKYNAYERMCVWDALGGTPLGGPPLGGGSPRGGAGSLSFDCAELGEPNLGYIAEGRALQTACRRAATAAGVVFIDSRIVEILVDEDRVRVSLSDERLLQSQLLIAADGADSRARKLLGIDTAGHAYHQDALVLAINAS